MFVPLAPYMKKRPLHAVYQPQYQVSIVYETNVEQLNQFFSPEAVSEHENIFKKFRGGGGGGGHAPRPPINNQLNVYIIIYSEMLPPPHTHSPPLNKSRHAM